MHDKIAPDLRAAATQALEALSISTVSPHGEATRQAAREALRAALAAQPAPAAIPEPLFALQQIANRTLGVPEMSELHGLAMRGLAAAPAAPAEPRKPLTSHEQYWVQIRHQVIAALAAEGLRILSDKNRVWVERVGRVVAQSSGGAAPAGEGA